MEEGFDESQVEKKGQLFSDIGPENSFTELESLCMNCGEQGITRLLLTKIPFFKEIIVMAFSCPHCAFRSNEVQSGGAIAEKGIRIELQVGSKYDLNRQVVKSDSASLYIPQLDFEIPSITQRGQLNTVEGFLMQSVEQIRAGQEERRKIDPETTAKIDAFLEKLEKCLSCETLFTLVLDDPAGNSFIENPYAPKPDPMAVVTHYKRTEEQNSMIGLTSDETYADRAIHQRNFGTEFKVPDPSLPKYDLDFDKYDYTKRVMEFPGNCSNCNAPCETKMVAVDIPYFKEVIIMASTCDACGYRSNEVKAGGAISEKGRRITLKVQTPEDMTRNILKSETASVIIPELDFEVSHGSLGGRFTTVEGLIVGIKEELERTNPFLAGDSSDSELRNKYMSFITGLGTLSGGDRPFTLILDDPVANSYIQNNNAPDPDPQLTEEEYTRSFEQNEELGLNDIKTENY